MKFTVEQLREHLLDGGQVWRQVQTKRFFYKIEDGRFMCRVNEMGGWNKSHSSIEKVIQDDLNVALKDYDAGWDQKVFTTQLPDLKGHQKAMAYYDEVAQPITDKDAELKGAPSGNTNI